MSPSAGWAWSAGSKHSGPLRQLLPQPGERLPPLARPFSCRQARPVRPPSPASLGGGAGDTVALASPDVGRETRLGGEGLGVQPRGGREPLLQDTDFDGL
jgi:hypothetical protein